ncbi:MAG: response regulator [Candidatus Omnitrophica bacterium]|nr:response regulator [Candidatus Omnitrophota bacterium]
MPPRNVLVMDRPEGEWHPFLEEFFEDTQTCPQFAQSTEKVNEFFQQGKFEIVFINELLLSPVLSQKFSVLRQSQEQVRFFRIGNVSNQQKFFSYDFKFEIIPSYYEFQRKLVECLPLPEMIHLHVVDDERETGEVIREYFLSRKAPRFEVDVSYHGKEALEKIKVKKPDIIILDLKMPVMNGREFYRVIQEEGWHIPVIVFFDALYGEEIAEIMEWGRPAIVEKGAPLSRMPDMMALVKKMVYFA